MNIFSFVKSYLSILDVINEYTSLKKAGLYWKGTCPFHSEKDASFTVSCQKGLFYCFGCHAGGDVISFIERIEQCTSPEAVRFLIDRYNIDIPGDIEWEREGGSFEQKERYFTLCSIVAQWTYEQLLKSKAAQKYLFDRSIDQRVIKIYGIGYFPGGKNGITSLLRSLKKNNIIISDLIDAGIVSEKKGFIFSPFEERIIFPIRDHLGRHCGFGGRVFKKHDERSKYYNSRENSYFQKGKLLFGLDCAKTALQKKREAFLVEGYIDCTAMNQYGFSNVVSTLGTSCTVAHLQTLARYCSRIVILYDGDNAGNSAIMRLTELCWQTSLELNVVSLPVGEDPASFLGKNGDLTELIEKSKDIFEFFLELVGKDFHTSSLTDKIACVRKILTIIGSLNDSIKKAVLLQKAAAVFSMPYEFLQDELKQSRGSVRKVNKAKNEQIKAVSIEKKGSFEGISKLEKKIFFAIMNNVQLFKGENGRHLVDYFPEPLRSILDQLIKRHEGNQEVTFRVFLDTLDREMQQVVTAILLECDREIEKEEYSHLLRQFWRKNWKRMVASIKKQIEKSPEHSEEKKKLLNDFLILKKRICDKNCFS